jgi:hypothetical protein
MKSGYDDGRPIRNPDLLTELPHAMNLRFKP